MQVHPDEIIKRMTKKDREEFEEFERTSPLVAAIKAMPKKEVRKVIDEAIGAVAGGIKVTIV